MEVTQQTVEFLALEDPQDQIDYFSQHREDELQRTTVITCMGKVKRQFDNPTAADVVILGTEDRHVGDEISNPLSLVHSFSFLRSLSSQMMDQRYERRSQ